MKDLTPTELVSFSLTLKLESEVGDNVVASTATFTHNNADDERMFKEFDMQYHQLRFLVKEYIARRRYRLNEELKNV